MSHSVEKTGKIELADWQLHCNVINFDPNLRSGHKDADLDEGVSNANHTRRLSTEVIKSNTPLV